MSCRAANPPTGQNVVTNDDVKEYYGKVLKGTKDLKTNACTIGKGKIPKHIQAALGLVHEEVSARYYGCGLVIPECLEGTAVLDLGSGAGQDCFVLSKLVEEIGHVTGIDMTDEQLEVANKYIPYHTEKFGYKKPNVNFVKGYIEKLDEAGLKDNSFDIIVSNCVVNLSPDKRSVLKEAYRVLKEGGEFYFSDVYADRDLPEEIRKHKVLWGECIAGALWWEDLVKLTKDLGFASPRLKTAHTFELGSDELKKICGDYKFVSVTYRLFKLPQNKEGSCNVIYDGSITGYEDEFTLDCNNKFKRGEVVSVDSDVATILKSSRFVEDFSFEPSNSSAPIDPAKLPEHDPNPFKFLANDKDAASRSAGCCAKKPCC